MSEKKITKESIVELLQHWIEHGHNHASSYRKHAAEIEVFSPASAQAVMEAAELEEKCSDMLKKALKGL
jgi:hypothetical protein